MLGTLNLVANLVIFAGSLWAVLTHKIPTRSGGAAVLGLINFAVMGDLAAHSPCDSQTDTLLKLGVAAGVAWCFWRVEARHWFRRETA